MAIRKRSVAYYEKFRSTWNEASCTRDVAITLCIPLKDARAMAQQMQNEGYELQRFKGGQALIDYRERPPCKSPTCFAPGSPMKIEVMRARACRDESIWHPDDATPERAIDRVPHLRIRSPSKLSA